MKVKLTPAERNRLIKRSLDGESVSALCAEVGISRVVFYRWLARYKQEGNLGLRAKRSGRPSTNSTALSTTKYTYLSPSARAKMIEEIILQGSEPSEVAKKYNVSRVTLYKWLKRYRQAQTNGDEETFVARSPHIDRYFRQTPEKYEEAVLSLVAKHPDYGVRSLVANLPKIGGIPIIGHHGVQNVLRRHNLSTYGLRLDYARAQVTPITEMIGGVIENVTRFFGIEPELRHRVVRFITILSLTTFGVVVLAGLASLMIKSFAGADFGSSIGLVFAIVALAMGSVFFLYSLKNYLTMAIVLSFSQSEKKSDEVQPQLGRGFLARLLGLGGGAAGELNTRKVAGLEPDLSHINLGRRPYISVQIPFYNEKNVVERSIEAAINFNYPEYEVILCDDSTDETTELIRSYQKDYLAKGEKLNIKEGEGWTLTWVEVKPGVILKHLYRTSRQGYKGGALNLALKHTDPRAEFVAVFDADFVPYPDSLELFLKYFKVENNHSEDYSNSKVAAVQGYQWHVLNKSENWITRGIRSEYAGSYVVERSGEEIYQGLKQISGSVYLIRRKPLEEAGWGVSITEDFELTLRLYNLGYKVVYTPYIQAPAECVSTLKRLVRQRMRWAEGHSQNIKLMFTKIMKNPKITFAEKLEFCYLSPYYLQAFFFLVGTLSWLISEAIFPARLPFWTSLWGWSLVLTNILALPMLNAVGLFLEESEEKDYLGILSFLALTYILVPFQAYAAIKGFMEDVEGPWFRTPKTGRITDIFTRGRFYRFITGILPGKSSEANISTEAADSSYASYLSLVTANSRFNSFAISKTKKLPWLGRAFLSILLCFTMTLFSLSRNGSIVYATDIATSMVLGEAKFTDGGTFPGWGNVLQNGLTGAAGVQRLYRNRNANQGTNNYAWYSVMLPLGESSGGNAILPAGVYQLQVAKNAGGPANNAVGFRVQLLLTNNNGTSRAQLFQNYFTLNTRNLNYTLFSFNIGTLAANNQISWAAQNRLALRIWWNNASTAGANMNLIFNNSAALSKLVLPAPIHVSEIPKGIVLATMLFVIPAIPAIVTGKFRKNGGNIFQEISDAWKDILKRLLGEEKALDHLPV